MIPRCVPAHHFHALHSQPAKQFAESLSGLIERVTFFNEENGFAVLKVKAKGHRDQVTVVGSLPSVSAGEWVIAQGRWVQDREFGLQFKAEMVSSTAPTTKEGIEKYLGSGMVKGIGPVYAKKLVDRFGERIFDIIETESARLEELDGIGPKRRKRIKDAWVEQKVIREIMVFLHSNGVSTSRAVRIYLTRSISALYALHGALLVFMAGDVRRYLPVVRLLAVAGAVFGAVMFGIDYAVGMPLPWTVAEGPYVVLLSAVILWLTGRQRFPSAAPVA